MRTLTRDEVHLVRIAHHQLVTNIRELADSTPVIEHDVRMSPRPDTTVLQSIGVPVAPTPQGHPEEGLRRRLHVLAVEEGWPVGSGADT